MEVKFIKTGELSETEIMKYEKSGMTEKDEGDPNGFSSKDLERKRISFILSV